jgi:hypothetical protein
VVGAVDRHARVVEQAAGGDYHLGVARLHVVIGDHRRIHPAPVEQAEQAQRDVQHDPNVHPRVIGHPQAVGRDLLRMPPGLELQVGVRRVQEGLELAVAARGHPDLHRLDGLARLHRAAE